MLKFLCTFAFVMNRTYYFLLGREYADDVFTSIRINDNNGLDNYTSSTKPDVTEFFGEQKTVGGQTVNVTEIKIGYFNGVNTQYCGPYFNNKFKQQAKTCPYKQQTTINTIEDNTIVEKEQ